MFILVTVRNTKHAIYKNATKINIYYDEEFNKTFFIQVPVQEHNDRGNLFSGTLHHFTTL
jgi:hypothetical protein